MKTKCALILLLIIAIWFWLVTFTNTLLAHVPAQENRSNLFTVFTLLCACVMQIAAHFLRAKKSYMMIGLIRKTKIRTLFKAEAVGSLFNVLLPFRIGEFIRAHLVGNSLSISRAAVFLMIIAERIVDGYILSILVIIFTITFSQYLGSSAIIIRQLALELLGGSIFFNVVLLMIYRSDPWLLSLVHRVTGIFQNNIRDRLRFIAWSCNFGLKKVGKQTPWTAYYISSALMWLLYFGSTAAITFSMRGTISPIRLLTTALLPYLTAGTPLGPTYLTHYFNTYAYAVSGSIDAPSLISGGFVNWFVLVVPISICAIVLIFVSRRPTRPLRSNLEVMKEKLTRDIDISKELSGFLDAFFAGNYLSKALVDSEIKDRYTLIKTFKGGSNASTVLVWQDETLQVKKITLPQYKGKLITQRNWLLDRSHLPSLPRVTGSEDEQSYFSFNIEFRESFTPFFDFIHSEPIERSEKVLFEILHFVYKEIYVDREDEVNALEKLNTYIANKALGKIRDTSPMCAAIQNLLEYEKIYVNGRLCENFSQIIDKILQSTEAMADLSHFSNGPIHGDLTVDNIIVSPDGAFIVLDPNDENEVSDPVVDLGKLYQSLHSGYEFLCGLNHVNIQANSIQFEESISNKYGQLFDFLKMQTSEYADEQTRKSILFHEAIHFCRMLTYRVRIDNATAPAFYAIAVRLFNEYFSQYE